MGKKQLLQHTVLYSISVHDEWVPLEHLFVKASMQPFHYLEANILEVLSKQKQTNTRKASPVANGQFFLLMRNCRIKNRNGYARFEIKMRTGLERTSCLRS